MKNILFILKIAILGGIIEACLLSGIEGLIVNKADILSWALFTGGLMGLIKFARTYDLKWGKRNA